MEERLICVCEYVCAFECVVHHKPKQPMWFKPEAVQQFKDGPEQ